MYSEYVVLHYPGSNLIFWRNIFPCVELHHCSWHSTFRVLRPVMWLDKSEFTNHHTFWFIFTFSQTCGSYMNQNSRCAWRDSHSPCSQNLPLCTCNCACMVKIGPCLHFKSIHHPFLRLSCRSKSRRWRCASRLQKHGPPNLHLAFSTQNRQTGTVNCWTHTFTFTRPNTQA